MNVFCLRDTSLIVYPFNGGTVRVAGGLTLNLLTTTVVAPSSNACKWQMGFNSAFKGLSSSE